MHCIVLYFAHNVNNCKHKPTSNQHIHIYIIVLLLKTFEFCTLLAFLTIFFIFILLVVEVAVAGRLLLPDGHADILEVFFPLCVSEQGLTILYSVNVPCSTLVKSDLSYQFYRVKSVLN